MTAGNLIGKSKIAIPMISKWFNVVNPNGSQDTVMIEFDTNRTKIVKQSTLIYKSQTDIRMTQSKSMKINENQ